MSINMRKEIKLRDVVIINMNDASICIKSGDKEAHLTNTTLELIAKLNKGKYFDINDKILNFILSEYNGGL